MLLPDQRLVTDAGSKMAIVQFSNPETNVSANCSRSFESQTVTGHVQPRGTPSPQFSLLVSDSELGSVAELYDSTSSQAMLETEFEPENLTKFRTLTESPHVSLLNTNSDPETYAESKDDKKDNSDVNQIITTQPDTEIQAIDFVEQLDLTLFRFSPSVFDCVTHSSYNPAASDCYSHTGIQVESDTANASASGTKRSRSESAHLVQDNLKSKKLPRIEEQLNESELETESSSEQHSESDSDSDSESDSDSDYESQSATQTQASSDFISEIELKHNSSRLRFKKLPTTQVTKGFIAGNGNGNTVKVSFSLPRGKSSARAKPNTDASKGSGSGY